MLSTMHVLELIPEYSLDLLDEDTTILVSEHLTICESCLAEVRVYQGILVDLPLALTPAQPSTELKRQLMQKIHAPNPNLVSASHKKTWQRWSDKINLSAPRWGMVSLVAIFALLLGNLILWQQVNVQNTDGMPEMHRIALTGTNATYQAAGTIVISDSGEYGTIVVDRLPVLDSKQQYQLWLIKDGQRTSGGVFTVEDDGYASLVIKSPLLLSAYDAFGVTIEPFGGSPQPTGAKVLGG